jgi:hypothetical protein
MGAAEPLHRLRQSLADRYRLERELGRGGMATVYLAHDLRHDRPVALSHPGAVLVGYLKASPEWAPFRSRPDFQQLLGPPGS